MIEELIKEINELAKYKKRYEYAIEEKKKCQKCFYII